MTFKTYMFILACAGFLSSAVQASDARSDFAQLRDRHWQWTLDNSPSLARAVGDARGDKKLADLSLAHMDKMAREAAAMAADLARIHMADLPEDMKTDAQLLQKMLQSTITSARFGQRAMLFDSYTSWDQELSQDAREANFTTRAEYENYIARLHAFSAQATQAEETTRWAVSHHYVQPCIVVINYPKSLHAVSTPALEDSIFWKPFAGTRPALINQTAWTDLQARGRAAIAAKVLPALRNYTAFINQYYMPHCRQSTSITDLPQGKDYYAWRVAEETTTTLSAAHIHEIGLAEVARITAEMDKVAASAGYAGRRDAYIAELRSNPRYYAKSAEELLNINSRIAKYIDGQLPRLFGQLPRMPYTVKAVPDEIAEGNTTAYYEIASSALRRAGVYRVNTTHLDQRPLFEIPALTAHESVPGHHLQLTLQQEMPLSPMRRYLAGYTAFVEGWALYAESLGLDMDLYDTPEKNMGRLSYEMWRASRLVVDMGLHSKGWSREEAIAYMKAHTALSEANIDAEVTRYIGWPGQALGYKIGELSIKSLRRDAEQSLGEKFDLRAFNDAVLSQGAVPLDMLEQRMRTWIADQKSKP